VGELDGADYGTLLACTAGLQLRGLIPGLKANGVEMDELLDEENSGSHLYL